MAEGNERVSTAISDAELERRWSAVRSAMAEPLIDVLLMQANNDFMGGYVKYFTDIPATNGYPQTVVFPREDRMSAIGQGPFGAVRDLPPEGDGVRRGTARFMGTPSYASAHYTAEYDAVLAEKALTLPARRWACSGPRPWFALVDYLKRGKQGEVRGCLRHGGRDQGGEE